MGAPQSAQVRPRCRTSNIFRGPRGILPPSSPDKTTDEGAHFTQNLRARLFRPEGQPTKEEKGRKAKEGETQARENSNRIFFHHAQGPAHPLG